MRWSGKAEGFVMGMRRVVLGSGVECSSLVSGGCGMSAFASGETGSVVSTGVLFGTPGGVSVLGGNAISAFAVSVIASSAGWGVAMKSDASVACCRKCILSSFAW